MPNYIEFQKSMTRELMGVKDRVFNLIEDRHWGEVGKFREAILVDLLVRVLPDTVKVGTGFIIGDYEETTKQIDIIIYDSQYPMIFKKENFIIAPKESVLGIIEVKSKLTASNFTKTLEAIYSNARVLLKYGYHYQDRTALYSKDNGTQRPFVGLFAYESEDGLAEKDSVKRALKKNNGFLNHLVFGKDEFVKYWSGKDPNGEDMDNPFYRFYRIEDLAFGYFVSNLLESILIKTIKKHATQTTYNKAFYPVEKENSISLPDINCLFEVVDAPKVRISDKNLAILEDEESFASHLISYTEKLNRQKYANKSYYGVSRKNIEERYDFQKFSAAFEAREYVLINNLNFQEEDFYFFVKRGEEDNIDYPIGSFRKEDWYH